MKFVLQVTFIALATFGYSEDPPAPEAPPETMIRLETKIIQGPAAVVPPGAVIDPVAMKVRMKEISGEKGWDIMSAPSVVTREGMEAKVEVGRELPLAPGEVPAAPGEKPAFAGIALTMTGKSNPDGKLQIVAHCVLTELAAGKADPAPLLTFEQEIGMAVTPGDTVSLVVAAQEPGRFTTFLITPRRIDGAGKELP